ncbi:MAG TPA: molecular chaperone TorD family protein [Burkholderiales bacterium]
MSDDLERAELYLCFARSFLPPAGEAAFAALRDTLADDLEALCASPGSSAVDEFRGAVAAIADADALSRLYAKLFLAPPRRAQLNSGAYLDGGLMGRSVQALEACYRGCGLARSEAFRSPSDHVAVQLEFAAYLYACRPAALAAGHFLDSFPARWLPDFISDLENASLEAGAIPYLPLARLLAAAVARDAVPPPQEPRLERRRRALERARAKRAARGITPAEMAEIERRLRNKGLSTEHLPRAG